MVTRCYLCGRSTQRELVTAKNWWGNDFALVEHVPAWICQNCGEVYFDAETSRTLDQLRQEPPVAQHLVSVPVYAYAGTNGDGTRVDEAPISTPQR